MRTKSLLPLTRSSILMLLLYLGTVSAGDSTDPDPVGLPAAAPCNLMECTNEIERCGSVCDWLFNGTVRSLSLAPRIDNSPVDITLAMEPDFQSFLKEPPKAKHSGYSNVRFSMATTAEGPQPQPSSSSDPTKLNAPPSEPHWSHLPFFKEAAEAEGHRIPLPFGIGATFYDAKQPVKVKDLQLGAFGVPPQSTTFVKVNNPIVSWQQNVSTRLDVWLFPFFNIYGVAGFTRGHTRGRVAITGPVFGLLNQEVRLFAEFEGPTAGGGMTLGGGFKVADWHNLAVFALGDINHTVTFLSFKNESLIAHTKPQTTVAAPRLGLRGDVNSTISMGMWVGGMYQKIQEEVAGSVAGRSLDFIITQRAASPWNTLIGGQIEFGRHFNVILETGIGDRSSILAGAVFRF